MSMGLNHRLTKVANHHSTLWKPQGEKATKGSAGMIRYFRFSNLTPEHVSTKLQAHATILKGQKGDYEYISICVI